MSIIPSTWTTEDDADMDTWALALVTVPVHETARTHR